MNLTHTPLIDESSEYKDQLNILPGKAGSTLAQIDENLSQMSGDLKTQAMNYAFTLAFVWKRADALDYLLQKGVTLQEGFFDDLEGALHLYGRLRYSDLESPSIPAFILVLQDYALNLGDVFKYEATSWLLPRRERSMVEDSEYQAEFIENINLYKLVFGANVFSDPEVGNLVLSHIQQSASYECRYGEAFKVLTHHMGNEFKFNDQSILKDLLGQPVYRCTDFFKLHSESILNSLEDIKRPATQSKFLTSLVSELGEIVLPALATNQQLHIGSSSMAKLNLHLLHGHQRGVFDLAEQRDVHDSLAEKILSHPAFATQAALDKGMREVEPNVFSAASALVARHKGINFQLSESNYTSFCTMLTSSTALNQADKQSLFDFLEEQISDDLLRAFRATKRTHADNPVIVKMGELEGEALQQACLIQMCYEQNLKQVSKGNAPLDQIPFLDSGRKRARNPLGNPYVDLAPASTELVRRLDDERILAHQPKNKRFTRLMIMSGLIKDSKYIALLTPREQEEMLAKDLGL